jgi:hypothetical protein
MFLTVDEFNDKIPASSIVDCHVKTRYLADLRDIYSDQGLTGDRFFHFINRREIAQEPEAEIGNHDEITALLHVICAAGEPEKFDSQAGLVESVKHCPLQAEGVDAYKPVFRSPAHPFFPVRRHAHRFFSPGDGNDVRSRLQRKLH